MADKYLGFKYNNIHSFNDYATTGFKAYILNDGEDLAFYNVPSFTNEFAFPKFGETSYLLGTNKENRILSFRVFVKEATLSQYKNFLNWLSIDSGPAILQFDYNQFFGYNVKINLISNGNFTVNQNCDPNNPTYNVELDVEFVTIGDYAAQLVQPQSFNINDGIDNNSDFADILIGNFSWVNSTKLLTITNKTNQEMYFNFSWTSGTITVTNNTTLTTLYEISSISSAKIYSKFGLILSTDNSFVEAEINTGRVSVPAKTISADGSLVLHINCTAVITFEAIVREVI